MRKIYHKAVPILDQGKSRRFGDDDPNEGRPGYTACPVCGRYVQHRQVGELRSHRMPGINRIPCPKS